MRFSELTVGDIFTIVSCEDFNYTHLFKKINPITLTGYFGSETRNAITLATRSYSAITYIEDDSEVVLQTILIMARGDGAIVIAENNGKVLSNTNSQTFELARHLKIGDFFVRDGGDWGVCMACKIHGNHVEIISLSDQQWRYLDFTESIKKVLRPC